MPGQANTAIGFRAHAGWAAAVCIAGPTGFPAVVRRHRLLLTDTSLPCEPYHAAKRMDFTAAEGIIRDASERAQQMATRWIRTVIVELGDHHLVGIGVVLGTGRPDFTLRQALATHAATHNAEGWLFREALMRAGEGCGLRVVGALETAAYWEAAAAAGLPAASIEERVPELGREVGAPWGKDQKLAAAVAWLALGQRS